MDPDAALEQLRSWADGYDTSDCEDRWCEEAVDAFHGLDRWLTNGGFAPTDWDPAKREPGR